MIDDKHDVKKTLAFHFKLSHFLEDKKINVEKKFQSYSK